MFISNPEVYANPINTISDDYYYSGPNRDSPRGARGPNKNVLSAHSMRKSKNISGFPFFGIAALIVASGYAWGKFKKD